MDILYSRKFKKIICLFITSLLVLVVGVSVATSSNTISRNLVSANAFSFCSNMGSGMHADTSLTNWDNLVAPSASNRIWTAQELYSESIRFTVYYGKNPEDGPTGALGWALADSQIDQGIITSGWNDRYLSSIRFPLWSNEEAQERIKDIRGLSRCGISAVMYGHLPNGQLRFTGWVTSLVNRAVTSLFDPNFICRDPGNPEGNCINLLRIIGGDGTDADGGMIGTLTSSLFIPLSMMAALIAGIWLLIRGMIKGQIRDALMGAVWAVMAFIIGFMLLMHPAMIARAPMTANNVIATCLLSALNGENCLSGQATGEVSSFVGPECNSSANVDITERAQMQVNALSCGIWRTFVLDQWARGQFGRSYHELYTMNPPPGGTIWEGTPEGYADLYCVSMGTSAPASFRRNQSGNNRRLDINMGEPICNIALYQLHIMAGHRDNVNSNEEHEAFPRTWRNGDRRFFNIIGPAASDVNMWTSWAPTAGGGFGRLGTGFVAGLSVIIAGISLMIFSLHGHVFNITGTILMVFAPLFFLCAIHPGRGKKMFLGWLEMVISSILKYMASALFVIIALMLYSAVLQNTTGFGSFVGILVMVLVMFAYRKEIVNMMGKVSMGGEQFSNAIGDRAGKMGKALGRGGAAIAGGAIGSKLAGGTLRSGAMGSLRRDLARGSGVGGQAFRTFNRMKPINEAEAASKSKAKKQVKKTNKIERKRASYLQKQSDPNNKNKHTTKKTNKQLDKWNKKEAKIYRKNKVQKDEHLANANSKYKKGHEKKMDKQNVKNEEKARVNAINASGGDGRKTIKNEKKQERQDKKTERKVAKEEAKKITPEEKMKASRGDFLKTGKEYNSKLEELKKMTDESSKNLVKTLERQNAEEAKRLAESRTKIKQEMPKGLGGNVKMPSNNEKTSSNIRQFPGKGNVKMPNIDNTTSGTPTQKTTQNSVSETARLREKGFNSLEREYNQSTQVLNQQIQVIEKHLAAESTRRKNPVKEEPKETRKRVNE